MIPRPDEINEESKMAEKFSITKDLNSVTVTALVLSVLSSFLCMYLYSSVHGLREKDKSQSKIISDLTKKNSELEKSIKSVSGVENRVDSLVSCINDYMDVVGDSGGFSYTYYYCR